jgi:hypothetical protein
LTDKQSLRAVARRFRETGIEVDRVANLEHPTGKP